MAFISHRELLGVPWVNSSMPGVGLDLWDGLEVFRGGLDQVKRRRHVRLGFGSGVGVH